MSFPRASEEDYSRRLGLVKTRLDQGEISYAAPFNSSEAQRLMPTIPAKMVDKDKL